jgi:hypothetical protein
MSNYRPVNFLATPLWHAPDFTALISNVSTSMTNNMHSAYTNTTTVFSTTYRQQTYVRVRWPWLVLPTGAILFGIAFLILTIMHTAQSRTLLWKSSSLALLLHGINSEFEEENVKAFQERLR